MITQRLLTEEASALLTRPLAGKSVLEGLHEARILIVDDLEANISLVAQILKKAGYKRLESTTDSREVISMFTAFQPDLLLLDLIMPRLDGFQVMELLKLHIPSGSYLPILVLTADVSRAAKQRALSMGAKGIVIKPFDSTEVLLTVSNLLETHFLHKQLRDQNNVLEERVRERTSDLADMLEQLLAAEEQERRRLAMDLHDGPLQSLGVSIMALNRAIRRLERGEYDLVEREQHMLRSALAGTVTEVRGVLANLGSEALTGKGLSSALRTHVERFSDVTGIQVALDDSLHRYLPPGIELLMYRLAQEALSNIRRHAQATVVEMVLRTDDGYLEMTVNDDGLGFDVEAVLAHHPEGERLGLKSMQERIRNANGTFIIESSPGKGTTLMLRCPFGSTGIHRKQVRRSHLHEGDI